MHTQWNKSGRARGYLAAVVLSSLAVFGVGCSKQSRMPTNPAGDKSLAASMRRAPASSVLPLLGSAANFAVLGGSTVTSTGLSVLTGDLGVSPGTAITGFGPAVFSGTLHAGDPVAAQAQNDLTIAYNAVAGMPCGTSLAGQDLGGMTLSPGVYCFTSSAGLTGKLVLDARGDANAVFMFQIGSTLTTATNSSVVLIHGASPCNVFWQVGSSATLGTGTAFAGSILANASISMTTGVRIAGHALARSGAVTMITDTVSAGRCSPGGGGGGADSCSTKVSGEGSIPAGGSIAKFEFEVTGSSSGRVKGELRYVGRDSNATNIKIKKFTSFSVVDSTATFGGAGTINGMRGTFTVAVKDAGRSGSADTFSITVQGGATYAGTLRNGNIKIHAKHCDGRGDDGDDDGHGGDGGHGDGDDDGHDGDHHRGNGDDGDHKGHH